MGVVIVGVIFLIGVIWLITLPFKMLDAAGEKLEKSAEAYVERKTKEEKETLAHVKQMKYIQKLKDKRCEAEMQLSQQTRVIKEEKMRIEREEARAEDRAYHEAWVKTSRQAKAARVQAEKERVMAEEERIRVEEFEGYEILEIF